MVHYSVRLVNQSEEMWANVRHNLHQSQIFSSNVFIRDFRTKYWWSFLIFGSDLGDCGFANSMAAIALVAPDFITSRMTVTEGTIENASSVSVTMYNPNFTSPQLFDPVTQTANWDDIQDDGLHGPVW